MILYRPVGLEELVLIYDSGMKAFPARLPQHPIFYPVLRLEYACQTSSDRHASSPSTLFTRLMLSILEADILAP